MRKVRFAYLYLTSFLSRYFSLIGSVLLTILIILLILIKFEDQIFKTYLSEGVVGTYTEDNLPVYVTSLLSRGLFYVDSTGTPQPDMVKSWTVNADSNLYVLKLKDNLYWEDGTKVKSSDIVLSVEQAEITYPDDDTIQIKLADSFSPLPAVLNQPVLKKGTEVGIGPYTIDKVEDSNVFIKKITLASHDPNLPSVVIRFYPSEQAAVDALKIGEVQSLLGVSDPSDLVSQSPFGSESKINYTRLVTIFYNTKDATLGDKNFRLALSFSAPSTPNEATASTSISPNSWAFNGDVKDYLDNPDEAKVYLDKVKNPKAPIVLTATSSLESVGKQVVSAWNTQGINATLKVESGIPQNFQALLISQDIPADPDQYSLWHSTQLGTNISHESSPRVDKDLEDGRKESDITKRKTSYADFQKVLLDDSPAAFLYFPKYNVVFLKKIESGLDQVLKLQFKALSL